MRPAEPDLRANLGPFLVLVGVNALVGAMVGLERSLLPAVAEGRYGVAAGAALVSFVGVFGVTKALANLAAGHLGDRWGRKPLLVAGWVVALPVPVLLMAAPSWGWIVAANALLGVSQGLSWSAAVVMKIDLAGPARRGLATGVNEFAGYVAVALSALVSGALAARYGLGAAPFAVGLVYATLGLLASVVLVRETLPLARLAPGSTAARPPRLFWRVTAADPTLSAVTQAGFVNNLNDALAWGVFPLRFAAAGLDVATIAALAAVYPAVWGLGQLAAGAASDRLGRKPLIVAGMLVQAAGIALVALGEGLPAFATGQALLGLGTALVYPTLLAAVGDVAAPSWRGAAVGVYRLWRDLGYAAGALLVGIAVGSLGVSGSALIVAALTAASGVLVAVRMPESLRAARGGQGAGPTGAPPRVPDPSPFRLGPHPALRHGAPLLPRWSQPPSSSDDGSPRGRGPSAALASGPEHRSPR